jgi:hypothetical protein
VAQYRGMTFEGQYSTEIRLMCGTPPVGREQAFSHPLNAKDEKLCYDGPTLPV